MDRSGANEDTYPMLVISRLITVTYLPIFSEMGRGSTQEPPRRPFEISIYCTVDAIWNQFDIYMHQNLPQYLICMFQDSVPAGSYNDPFLSSVCKGVCV